MRIQSHCFYTPSIPHLVCAHALGVCVCAHTPHVAHRARTRCWPPTPCPTGCTHQTSLHTHCVGHHSTCVCMIHGYSLYELHGGYENCIGTHDGLLVWPRGGITRCELEFADTIDIITSVSLRKACNITTRFNTTTCLMCWPNGWIGHC